MLYCSLGVPKNNADFVKYYTFKLKLMLCPLLPAQVFVLDEKPPFSYIHTRCRPSHTWKHFLCCSASCTCKDLPKKVCSAIDNVFEKKIPPMWHIHYDVVSCQYSFPRVLYNCEKVTKGVSTSIQMLNFCL